MAAGTPSGNWPAEWRTPTTGRRGGPERCASSATGDSSMRRPDFHRSSPRSTADCLIAESCRGTMPVRRLRTADLDAWYGSCVARAASAVANWFPNTVNRMHAIIRRALNQAVRWGWITVNPASPASPLRAMTPDIVTGSPNWSQPSTAPRGFVERASPYLQDGSHRTCGAVGDRTQGHGHRLFRAGRAGAGAFDARPSSCGTATCSTTTTNEMMRPTGSGRDRMPSSRLLAAHRGA